MFPDGFVVSFILIFLPTVKMLLVCLTCEREISHYRILMGINLSTTIVVVIVLISLATILQWVKAPFFLPSTIAMLLLHRPPSAALPPPIDPPPPPMMVVVMEI